MGIKKSLGYRDYWSSEPKLNDTFISNLMSRHRFDWILSNLHLNVMMPNRNSPDYDRLYNVRAFLKMILRNFKKCFLAGIYNIRIYIRIYNKIQGVQQFQTIQPNETDKGYKISVLADKSGYFLNGDIYSGKSEQGVTKDLGGFVVRKLSNDLQGGSHKNFFDNYFASYDLVKDLKEQNLDPCGTV